MPKVSILCATYNSLRFLPDAVDSVLTQQGVDFELIIVDDGSNDATPDYLASLDDARIRCLRHAENRGRSRAVNTAMAEARGEYIALVDADDVWEKNKLALQCAVLDDEADICAVFSHVSIIDASGTPCNEKHALEHGVFNQSPSRFSALRTFFFAGNFLNNSSSLFRRSALRPGEELFDIRLKHLHDQDLWLRLLLRGDYRVLPRPLVRYRIHDDNVSRKSQVLRRSQLEQALTLERFREIDDPDLFARIFPEAQAFRPVTEGNIAYYVAQLALAHEYTACSLWGFLQLSRLFAGKEKAEAIERDFGFSLHDYYDL